MFDEFKLVRVNILFVIYCIISGELVEFEKGIIDIALNLKSNNVHAALMDNPLLSISKKYH